MWRWVPGFSLGAAAAATRSDSVMPGFTTGRGRTVTAARAGAG